MAAHWSHAHAFFSPVSPCSSPPQQLPCQCLLTLRHPKPLTRPFRAARMIRGPEMGSLVRDTGASILICRGFSRRRDSSDSFRVCNAVEGEMSFVAAADVDVETQAEEFASVEEIKAALYTSLEGLNRGIFGVQNARKAEVERLLELLEAKNPSPRPTDDLDKVKGEWKLVYSTISILGSKRTKLGLRDFITLGDFVQIIDVDQRKAVNRVGFSVAGLGMLSGSFTIEASYTIASPSRVDIQFESSRLVPEQLLSLFQKNYDLLLSIFNPEGWLEITYVDDTLRVGRDDKGNVFLVERI